MKGGVGNVNLHSRLPVNRSFRYGNRTENPFCRIRLGYEQELSTVSENIFKGMHAGFLDAFAYCLVYAPTVFSEDYNKLLYRRYSYYSSISFLNYSSLNRSFIVKLSNLLLK